MKIKRISKIIGGQDGAIYGSELFRFNAKGECHVYDLSSISCDCIENLQPSSYFLLDRADTLVPHCNAVCFGCEFYAPDDEFPLLYANVYNNYAKAEDKRIGVCLVYRIQRSAGTFSTTLVQMIEIGFCEDASLWKANSDTHGVRPYGNFVIDTEKKSYWAFVMRNEALGTRYFRFDLPSVHEGEVDHRLNIKRVVLQKEDIREYFDSQYCRYIQGATLHKGKIYSTEGFTNSEGNRPAIRVIDLTAKQETYYDIMGLGFREEAEFISFYNDVCLYSDCSGNLYTVDF